jgi:superfamily I DNA and/or RNA helicase
VISLLREIASADFMKALLAETTEDEKPIGVICMYADQKHLVQKLFSEQDWASQFRRFVKIDTVDSYQGKQNRIIFLSTTRNNLRYEQGYVCSPERINVSLSRAMDRLVIVGAARMWKDHNKDTPLGSVFGYINGQFDQKDFLVVEAKPTEQVSR